MAPDWSEREVALITDDYLTMLLAELRGEHFNKTSHRRKLLRGLNGRSEGSVEFKHQNLSYVFWKLGLPYIEGYKPARNAQGLLYMHVAKRLAEIPNMIEQLAATSALVPDVISEPGNFDEVVVGIPKTNIDDLVMQHHSLAVDIDFASRDAANRTLGHMGEKWVFGKEQNRLSRLGRDDLATRVEWVSQTVGDGLGFDILSWSLDGRERPIEVKTTNLHATFPFVVTQNELEVSRKNDHDYKLYRVFHFSRQARLFVLDGPLNKTCVLSPSRYLAAAAP